MYPITPEQLEEAIFHRCEMRTGRSIGRTLYLMMPEGEDICIGMLDSPYLAHKLSMLWNASLNK